jgi:hypothetical protein
MTGFTMTRSSCRTLVTLLVAVLAWAGSARAEGPSGDEYSIRWTNGLHTADLRFNALSTNRSAGPEMVLRPLRTDVYRRGTGNPILRNQLADPSARAFMKYVVECALTPAQQVLWEDFTGVVHRFEGRLGLCSAWEDGAPSLACQRMVSACVLARNNAEGKRVLFSGRGNRAIAPAFSPKPQVSVDPFKGYTRAVVESVMDCTVPESGVSRACGFQTERVGTCKPGDTVSVGAGGVPDTSVCGAAPLGATLSGTVVMRVCEGLHGCNASRVMLAQSEGTCSSYLPAVSFTCPARGVFSVMIGSYDTTQTAEAVVAARGDSSPVTYPASERQIFKVREGAFYGNLWAGIAPGVHVYVDEEGRVHKDVQNVQVAGSIYPKMYSCQSPTFTSADAYANERLCTLPGTNCVARPLGRCDAVVGMGRRCNLNDASGNGDYGQCVGLSSTEVYGEVVTPYLLDACDNVSDLATCATSPD